MTIRKILHKLNLYKLAFPPGHYSSPIPNVEEALEELNRVRDVSSIPDVNLRTQDQIKLFENIASFIKEIPFVNDHDEKFRYHFNNNMFQHMDGSVLFGLVRYIRPKKYIEVGSGFSSALLLDVNGLMVQEPIHLTFIEPYPIRLKSLLNEKDYSSVSIIESKIQDVDMQVFDQLEENDILFLDTTHIVKTGGDVTFWLFNVLPRLKKGVIIQIHDILWPFEYSEEWIKKQKCYNEVYLIRAFLMNNLDYHILLFNSFLKSQHSGIVDELTPDLKGHHGGGSIWIQKN